MYVFILAVILINISRWLDINFKFGSKISIYRWGGGVITL